MDGQPLDIGRLLAEFERRHLNVYPWDHDAPSTFDIRRNVVPDETVVEDAIFERQRSIRLVIPERAALVGCGGVGAWLGFFLALAGVPNIDLFDSDEVSESNLNRMPYGPSELRKPKTEALKSAILGCRPQCKVECYPNFSPKFADAIYTNPENVPNWIVATTDTWQSRKDVYGWVLRGLTRYIEVAAEGEFGSIAAAPAEWATIDEEQPGYASVPVWVGPAVMAATMACAHILHDTLNPDQSARLGWYETEEQGGRIAFSYRKE